jgi:hypothetical protein
VTDFLQEVEEDLKRERAEKLWVKYSIYVYAAAALVVAAVGGYRYYDTEQIKAAGIAGAKYNAALMLSRDGKADDAAAQFSGIIAEGGAYKDLARLKITSEMKDAAGAKAGLTAVANDIKVDQPLRDAATLRLALGLIDTGSYEDVLKLIEPLSKPGQAFRMSALELLGLSAYRNGKTSEAINYMKMLTAEAESTDSARARANLILALLQTDKK